MAFKMRMKNMSQVSMKKVVRNLVVTVIALWVGGLIITEVGGALNGTCSPFYRGLTLIGWTVGTVTGNGTNEIAAGLDSSCLIQTNANLDLSFSSYPNTITDTSGAGILTVVGLIGIASVVLQFVDFRF